MHPVSMLGNFDHLVLNDQDVHSHTQPPCHLAPFHLGWDHMTGPSGSSPTMLHISLTGHRNWSQDVFFFALKMIRVMLLLGRALENLSYFHIYWPNVGLANWISSSSTSTMSYFFNPAQPKTCSTIAGLACQRSGLGLGDAQAYNRRGHWFFGKGLCAWEHCWGMRAVSVEFEQFNSAVNP